MRELSDRGCALLPASQLPLPLDVALEVRPTAAGDRGVLREPWCRDLAATLRAALIQRAVLAADAVAVQCTLFQKDADRNWLVALHQDLAVPLCERRDVPGFSAWSQKDGVPFAHAPDELLARMLGARVHLDSADEANGALFVVPGSHRHGRLEAAAANALRERDGELRCEARVGDVWLLRPLLLHRSAKSSTARPRRVLHFLFGPPVPGPGLAWPA